MSQISCPGVVVTDTSGVALCQDMGGAPLAWTTTPAFEISALDPVLMSGAFTAGFVLVGTGWALGYSVKLVLSMLK